jgi:hypothetical protein
MVGCCTEFTEDVIETWSPKVVDRVVLSEVAADWPVKI